MTKEEWQEVEKALGGIYGRAKIKADGFEVVFSRRLVSKNRLAIVTYVDGYMKGVWIDAGTEYPEQRCLRPASRYMCKPKERASLKKLGKRLRSSLGPAFDPDRKWHYFEVSWHSVAQIRRHYQKTFQSLELLEVLG